MALALAAVTPCLAQVEPAVDPPRAIRFADFYRQPIGPRGLEMSSTLMAAQGHSVRLVGYMVAQEQLKAGQFLFTPRPVRMSEDADGDADDLPASTVTVLLPATMRDHYVPHREGLIALSGRLDVGRVEDSAGRVSWIRLTLDPASVSEAAVVAEAPRMTPDPPGSPLPR